MCLKSSELLNGLIGSSISFLLVFFVWLLLWFFQDISSKVDNRTIIFSQHRIYITTKTVYIIMSDDSRTPQPERPGRDEAQPSEEANPESPTATDETAQPPTELAQGHHTYWACASANHVANNSGRTVEASTLSDSDRPYHGANRFPGVITNTARNPAPTPANSPQQRPQTQDQDQVPEELRLQPQFDSSPYPHAHPEPPSHSNTPSQATRMDFATRMDLVDMVLQEHAGRYFDLASHVLQGTYARATIYALVTQAGESLRACLRAFASVMASQGRDTSSIERVIESSARLEESMTSFARQERRREDGREHPDARMRELERLREVLEQRGAEISRLRERIRSQTARLWNQRDIMRQLNWERNEALRQLLRQQELNRERQRRRDELDYDWDVGSNVNPEDLGYMRIPDDFPGPGSPARGASASPGPRLNADSHGALSSIDGGDSSISSSRSSEGGNRRAYFMRQPHTQVEDEDYLLGSDVDTTPSEAATTWESVDSDVDLEAGSVVDFSVYEDSDYESDHPGWTIL
ncbi:hypothetical protein F4776DRAFT_240582 [Hypoxylon sp. NC0597]|nr:hypothetical protein F4776DRAFT_240582 [Hypoxylon sp. NC0597]